MDEVASRTFLQAQVELLQQCTGFLLIEDLRVDGWDVFVTLTSKKDEKKYTIRLRCDGGYPLNPPSVVFVNPANHSAEGNEFWPNDGERAFKRSQNPPFICVPGIREYHSHHQGTPFTTRDVSLSKIVTELVTMMNK
jgi:hypothetical protein